MASSDDAQDGLEWISLIADNPSRILAMIFTVTNNWNYAIHDEIGSLLNSALLVSFASRPTAYSKPMRDRRMLSYKNNFTKRRFAVMIMSVCDVSVITRY